jgi:nucleotide-binding universal stress UspA family protein
MPSTIVCGVDTSDAAAAVADTAQWLARALSARLLVLHISEEPASEGKELLASLRDRLTLPADDIRQTDGTPTDRLLEAVQQDGAELLVVGSRGRGSISSAVFGSVSRRLATDAPARLSSCRPKPRRLVGATPLGQALSAVLTGRIIRPPPYASLASLRGAWDSG